MVLSNDMMVLIALLNDKLAGMDVSDGDRKALRKEVLAKLGDEEAPESKKEIKLGLTTSGAYEEAFPLPPPSPVGSSQRPRPVSSRAHGRNSDSEKHVAATCGVKNNIQWI